MSNDSVASRRGGHEEDHLLSRVRKAAELVISDLRNAAPHPVLTLSGPNSSGSVDVILTDSSGMSCGFAVSGTATDQEILYAVANRIPDGYVDLYSVGLPLVPGTQRPAVPRFVRGQVLWVDPKNESTWSSPVGSYGTRETG
ncbi:hypothetical protein [Streptomyces sp. NPDC021224]|uniref:hypothetical protein n=1 Tax=unclassified Streptomyces TaxID=2593676 RepID=UPI0037B30F22